MRKISTFVVLLLALIGSLLAACSQESHLDEETSIGTVEGTLRPYPSESPSATPLPTNYVSPTLSPTITPTPTQVYYEIQLGDDMYSIAWRYNVSPEAIMTANPTVNPNAMIVGTSLLIPVTPMPETTKTATVALSQTATPRYAELHKPDCYPEALGGLWCFVLVENDETGALENISGLVTIKAGDETRQEVAILPLNLLPPGESLPLIAYFQPPIPEDYEVSAQATFLLPVMPDDQRYVSMEIKEQHIDIVNDGRVVKVSGILTPPEGAPDIAYIWVSATAFDDEGRVVGVRRWDSSAPLSAGEELPFDLILYSMSGGVDRVALVIEARVLSE